MARIDDYNEARRLAVENLAQTPAKQLSRESGFDLASHDSLRVPFLNRVYRVALPDFTFEDDQDQDRDVPIQEQVLILHYLKAPDKAPPSSNWVAYREIPGAAFYHPTFAKRALDPLKRFFGDNLNGLKRSAHQLDGTPIDVGDVGFEFRPFPYVPLQVVMYAGDEEFPPDAGILFDKGAGDMLSPEDLAWLAGMLVYRLIALSR
ncbi:MAG: DUF3786 domain-containing protein [Desulfatibacillaceae bacterium]